MLYSPRVMDTQMDTCCRAASHAALPVFLLVVAGCACSSTSEPPTPPNVSPLSRIELADQDVRGISGLARAPDGTLWAVGERDHVLLALSATDGRTLSRRAIDGVDGSVDLESLAWLGNSRIAVGTERAAEGRQTDAIYFIDVGAMDARVANSVDLRYELWGIVPRGNQGIEGLCYADSILLAGVESPSERDGKRVAAIGRYDMERAAWTPLWLQLTSDTGKLSALDCRGNGDHLDVLAVERHFEVARVLRFSVPRTGDPGVIAPTNVLDLAPHKSDNDNFEGIVWVGDGSAALIVDNDFGSISAPNSLFLASF